MASLLGDLALGLRQAAGVLSPDIQKETFAEDARRGAAVDQLAAQTFLLNQRAAIDQATPQGQLAALQVEQAKRKMALDIKKSEYLNSDAAQAFIAKNDDVGLIRDMARRGFIPPDEALKAMKEAREGDKPISLGGGNGIIPSIDENGNRTWKLINQPKPMVEHNFPVQGGNGEPMVQPHISLDSGVTWKPIPGSTPSPKFAKQVAPVVKVGSGEEPPAITDDTLRMDAFRYLTDGTLPPNMGRGTQGAAQATKIRNEASRIAKDEIGMSVDDIRMAQLTNKAGIAAVAQLGKARAQILQFEKLATMSADVAVQESEKVNRTQFPVLNKVLQAGRQNVAGDPAALRFYDANETFVSEYAKVMGGGYGAAAATEGAQARAHQLLNTSATKEQYVQAVNLLKQEMANRKKSLDAQMDEERGRVMTTIHGAKTRSDAPASTTPKVFKFDAQGNPVQ